MQRLKDNLIGLNQNDKREVLLDYEEHFLDGKQQGRTEDEICEAMGDPREIAKEIKTQSNQAFPSNDGVNIAASIFGIILLSGACIALISLLLGVVTTAISGVVGAVAVAAVFSNVMLKIAAVSAVIFAVTICVLIALGIVKLIPIIIKWYKQLVYTLDNKSEKAKNVEYKKVKIHPIIWILVSILCVASLCGTIIGSVGFAKEMVEDFDREDVYEFRDMVNELALDHKGWVYYSDSTMEEFEESMEEFADEMEDFADDMDRNFDDYRGGFFFWRYVFGD